MNYEQLISRVNENPILQGQIQKMLDVDSEILNLVHSDWKERLLNDVLFQNYQSDPALFDKLNTMTHIKTQRVKSGNELKILVVGHFSFVSSFRGPQNSCSSSNQDAPRTVSFFRSQNCPPLNEIGQVFMDDTHAIDYCENAKFYVKPCVYSLCYCCQKYVPALPSDQYKDWWCLSKTKIFNGDTTRMVARSTIERDFTTSNFLGIFTLHVTHRQFYGPEFKRMKLNGKVHDLILFQESCLEPPKEIDIEFLPDFRPFREPPVSFRQVPEFVPSAPRELSNAPPPPMESQTDCTPEFPEFEPSPPQDLSNAPPAPMESNYNLTQTDCIPESYTKKREQDEGNDFHPVEEVKRVKLI